VKKQKTIHWDVIFDLVGGRKSREWALERLKEKRTFSNSNWRHDKTYR